MAFQYGPTPGYPPLLEALKDYLRQKGLPVDTNELMITTGSMQAINILTQEFVNPGDRVICENPSFIGGIAVFNAYRARIQSVELKEDGIDLDELEKTLDSEKDQAKILYIIPNFHNPGGVIYSKEKREALIQMMRGRDTIIIEDDAYGDLYLDEEVKSLTRPMKNDETDSDYICYAGSFSKILGLVSDWAGYW